MDVLRVHGDATGAFPDTLRTPHVSGVRLQAQAQGGPDSRVSTLPLRIFEEACQATASDAGAYFVYATAARQHNDLSCSDMPLCYR